MILNHIPTTERAETIKDMVYRKTDPRQYKELGIGVFGTVIEHPNPKLVIKIGRGIGGTGRDGWLLWAQASVKYPNPFVPRIVSLTVWENIEHHESAYLAVMERLIPFNGKENKEKQLAKMIHPTWETIRSLEDTARRARLNAEGSTKEQQNLYRAYSWCRDKHSGLRPDLHDKNWMVRETSKGNVPVIIDPFAW